LQANSCHIFPLISLFFLCLTLPIQEKEDAQDSVVTGVPKNGSGIKAGAYLVSEYIETPEKTHSFVKDGTASFGDVQFQYKMGLALGRTESFVTVSRIKRISKMRDYFPDKTTGRLYEYGIEGGVLSIYKTSGKKAEIVEEEPFVKLRNTGD